MESRSTQPLRDEITQLVRRMGAADLKKLDAFIAGLRAWELQKKRESQGPGG